MAGRKKVQANVQGLRKHTLTEKHASPKALRWHPHHWNYLALGSLPTQGTLKRLVGLSFDKKKTKKC